MTTFSLFKTQLAVCLLICLSLLSACATSPKPSSAVESVSFGERPTDYKKIIKNYFDKKRNGAVLELDKVHFLNEPNKYVFERFAMEEFGYRACALIPVKDVNKLRTHFFLIKNGKVVKHLYDSGLISLSSKFCNTELLALEGKMKAAPVAATPVDTNPVDKNGFKYISCQAQDNEVFFAFNPEKQQLLQQHDGKQIAVFDIQELSETYIVASTTVSRVSINRISGTMLYQEKGLETKANCKLTSQQRF